MSDRTSPKREPSPSPAKMKSDTLHDFIEGLERPDDAEIQAMSEIGRETGAAGLNSEGTLVIVPGKSL